jgi:hypothetical protein
VRQLLKILIIRRNKYYMLIGAAAPNPFSNYSSIFRKASLAKQPMTLINYNPIIVYIAAANHIRKAHSLTNIRLPIPMPQLLHRNTSTFHNQHSLRPVALLIQHLKHPIHNRASLPYSRPAIQHQKRIQIP